MRRFSVAAAAALVFGAMLALGSVDDRGFPDLTDAWAHPGQLSPKDDCHRHKAAGERHWHTNGTAERGGECVKRDGLSYRVLEVEAAPAAAGPPWVACSGTWAALTDEIGSYWAPSISDAAQELLICLQRAYVPRE